MSVKISWQEPKNRSLIFILVGLATLIQLIIVLMAAYFFPINSVYIFIFISIGVIVFISGVEILLAQVIHSLRFRRRQSKSPKKRKKLKKVSESWSIIIGAGITLGLFSVLYVIFSYFIIDPLTLVMLPVYGKFAFAEILTGIILVITVLFLDSVITKK
jgi:hypothetical protein